ncbi:MAG TPA: YraN family protein [Candidatus Nanopelagicales bacterium]|nr:YraN family protein [Candidatus Nanopelagicales bacterium]
MEEGAPARRTPAQRAGDRAEEAVARALAAAGWRVLGRRVRFGRLELDIVAIDPGPPPALVVVEVRWRRSRAFGLPEETVDRRKLGRLRRGAGGLAARATLADGARLPALPLRLDLVAVEPAATAGRLRLRHYRGIGEAGAGGPLW